MILRSDDGEPLTSDGLDPSYHPRTPGNTDAAAGRCLQFGNRAFPLREGENFVGRQRDADVWLRSPSVSRCHARLFVDRAAVIVEDLGSKNGTYVADRRIDTPARIVDGDWVRFGTVWVLYHAFAEEDAHQTAND